MLSAAEKRKGLVLKKFFKVRRERPSAARREKYARAKKTLNSCKDRKEKRVQKALFFSGAVDRN